MNETSSCSADYYLSRERAELGLADLAPSIAIRKIHLEMAGRYRDLAKRVGPSHLNGHGVSIADA
jgi:hypothetical protein